MEERINLDSPRYDQNTYSGRAKHFFIITNPLNLFCTSDELEKAKELVNLYKSGQEPPGLTEDQIWRAKNIYDSAYHPDTGEKMFIMGRMSAQVPMNMVITGGMLTFYKSTPTVIFWQWINQSFNAVVNYTNRSGDNPVSKERLGISYLLATGSATGTALGLNRMVKALPPICGRFVPFAAVAAANCINIPFMRSGEISDGLPITTKDGEKIGDSTTVAKIAIAQVVLSRVMMAVPGMAGSPLVMNSLEKGTLLKRYPWSAAPIQTAIVGFFLIFATPLCCAIFPQTSTLSASLLEDELKQKAKDLGADTIYYNKGL